MAPLFFADDEVRTSNRGSRGRVIGSKAETFFLMQAQAFVVIPRPEAW